MYKKLRNLKKNWKKLEKYFFCNFPGFKKYENFTEKNLFLNNFYENVFMKFQSCKEYFWKIKKRFPEL